MTEINAPIGSDLDPRNPYNQPEPVYDFDFDDLDIEPGSLSMGRNRRNLMEAQFLLENVPDGFEFGSTVLCDNVIFKVEKIEGGYVEMREVRLT